MGVLQVYTVAALIALVASSARSEYVRDQKVASPPYFNVATRTNGKESTFSPRVLIKEIDSSSTLSSVVPRQLTVTKPPVEEDVSKATTSTYPQVLIEDDGINIMEIRSTDSSTVTPTVVESAEDREMRLLVDETLSLIAEGEVCIPFDPRQRDLVLLVGNTGAGKTTVAKFLTEVENLEAYDVGDRILIRDIINNGTAQQQHKISVNSTIISKTIFPDRIIDEETGTVFYDMPGFSDTRNASVEIANAWFMKMVADHARRVKIIFVVNYFALRSGGTRTNFKQLLEHAVDYVRVPEKLRNAIGLIATKVESSKKVKRIISDVSFFLRQTSSSLAQVFPDELKRNKTAQLVDAFLSTPNRISFFRQPEDVGYLIEMDDVMFQHSHMKDLIQNNTKFMKKDTEDFGISLSPKAVLVVLRIADVTYTKVRDVMTVISNKVAEGFNIFVAESRPETLGIVVNTQKKIGLFVKELQGAITRAQYFQTLSTLRSKLSILSNVDIHEDLMAIKKHERSFRFFEDVSNKTLHPKVVEWTNPMEHLVRDSLERVTDFSMGVNRHIEQATLLMGKSIVDSLLGRVQTSTNKSELLVEFEESSSEVAQIVENLKSARTFNEFAGHVLSIWNYTISDENSTVDFPIFVEDVFLEDESSKTPSPFRVLSWILPFDKVLTTMTRQVHQLKTDIEREIYIKDKEELERRLNETITAAANELQKELEAAEKELAERQRLEQETAQAVLYEHSDYSGDTYTVALRGEDCVRWIWSQTWNDRISSISVQQGCVRIWQHTDCEGASMCVCESISNLRNHMLNSWRTNWDESISNLRNHMLNSWTNWDELISGVSKCT